MTKLERLITVARQHPGKLTPATLQQVNAMLQRTGQQIITPPAPKTPWGRSLTLGESVAQRNMQPLPLPPQATTTPHQYALKQLEKARELEAARNKKAEQDKDHAIFAGCFAR